MPLQESLYQLEMLIPSYHPIIAMETVEEERVFSPLQALAGKLDMPLLQWSVTRACPEVLKIKPCIKPRSP